MSQYFPTQAASFSSLFCSLLTGITIACGASEPSSQEDHHDHDHDHHDSPVPSGRLLIADGSEGRVIVFDLAEGKAIESLSTEGVARVYASSDNTRGFAVLGSDDAVQGIDPGLHYEAHGDHFDVTESDPRVLSELVVSCSRPVHFVPHHGYSAAFCDGDGMLHVFEDSGAKDSYEVSSFDSGRAHHGVGLVAFDHIIVSTPNSEDEEDALPIGVRALGFDGDEVASFDECPGLHGEAATESHACFGCSDGVLCVHEEAGELSSLKLENPANTPEGVRVGTLKSSEASDVFIGNWGEDLVRIDLQKEELSALEVGEAYLGFSLTADGAHVIVLTAAGELKKFNASSGKLEVAASVFPEFEIEPGHTQLKPAFVVGAEHVYVVDPRHAELYEFELEELELTGRELKLEDGRYNSLALVALGPMAGNQ